MCGEEDAHDGQLDIRIRLQAGDEDDGLKHPLTGVGAKGEKRGSDEDDGLKHPLAGVGEKGEKRGSDEDDGLKHPGKEQWEVLHKAEGDNGNAQMKGKPGAAPLLGSCGDPEISRFSPFPQCPPLLPEFLSPAALPLPSH